MPVVDDVLAVRFVGNYNQSDGYYELGATYGPTVRASCHPNATWDPDLPARAGRTRTPVATTSSTAASRRCGSPNEDLILFQYEIVRDRSDAVPSFNDTPREPAATSRNMLDAPVFSGTPSAFTQPRRSARSHGRDQPPGRAVKMGGARSSTSTATT